MPAYQRIDDPRDVREGLISFVAGVKIVGYDRKADIHGVARFLRQSRVRRFVTPR